MEPRPHVLTLSPAMLVAHAAAHHIALPIEHARRILVDAWARPDAPQRRETVGASMRAKIAAIVRDERLEVVERAEDPSDGFVKYLLRAADGAVVEAVRIPLHRPGRFTVCLSSQVGCAMGCAFCATGRLGFSRNLATWEILAAFLAVRDEAPGRVSGAVFQGQGEPFHNYDAVIATAERLRDPCGGSISGDAITISTVGLVPQIRRFTAEGHPFRLIVSLTTTDEALRRRLLPIASRHPIAELAAVVRAHHAAHGGRITLAWVLLGGLNHGDEEVARLRELFDGVPIRLNLVDVNDARDDGFVRATDEQRNRLLDTLSAAGIPFMRRYSGGAARHAACGMLAATRFDDAP
ncbi:MAG TPA: radical SAM protein [Nannocystaceae bacterium]|nr:radical SAM protein [Nannocystaceae bacterium]